MACWMNGCEERDVWKHDVMNKCSLLSIIRCYTFFHSSLQTWLCRREHVLLIHLKLQTATCHDKHVHLNRNTVMSYQLFREYVIALCSLNKQIFSALRSELYLICMPQQILNQLTHTSNKIIILSYSMQGCHTYITWYNIWPSQYQGFLFLVHFHSQQRILDLF